MTVGGGGGSPKTISRTIYTLGGGTSFDVYQCPIDTMAIIDPLILVNAAGNGGVPGVSGFSNASLNAVGLNPVTGADLVETLQHTYSTTLGTQYFGNFFGAISVSSGSVVTTPMNFGRFEFSVTLAGGSGFVNETVHKGLILWPGERFRLITSLGAGSKLVYALREYGIAS